MDTPKGSGGDRAARLACQRWRITFSRDSTLGSAYERQGGREYLAMWEQALVNSGLPTSCSDAGRPRVGLGAALPAGITGRGELLDIWTAERLPAWHVRESLRASIPEGHHLVALDDVWLGAPALAGRIAAADYRVTLRGSVDRTALDAAARRLLAADRLIRERAKGSGVKTYDLRPLVISIETDEVALAGDVHIVVAIRTRIHPELGSGRPEEVIAALAEEVGEPLDPLETIRERLLLVDDLGT